MKSSHVSRIIHADPANLHLWAAGFTELGEVRVRFTAPNDLGVTAVP